MFFPQKISPQSNVERILVWKMLQHLIVDSIRTAISAETQLQCSKSDANKKPQKLEKKKIKIGKIKKIKTLERSVNYDSR